LLILHIDISNIDIPLIDIPLTQRKADYPLRLTQPSRAAERIITKKKRKNPLGLSNFGET